MIKEAIQYIVSLAAPDVRVLQPGISYNGNLVTPPLTKTIMVSDLESLVEYCASEDGEYVAVISDHKTVSICSHLDARDIGRQREIFITATAPAKERRPPAQMSQESAIVCALSLYADSADRTSLVSLLQKLTVNSETNLTDNGASQTVQTKVGISLAGRAEIPLYFTLRPFRTFTEIEQPEAKYTLRVNKGKDAPVIELIEQESDSWKQECVRRIRTHLIDSSIKAIVL